MRLLVVVLLTTIWSCSAWGQTYTISTLAGGGALPVNIPGTSATLSYDVPQSIAADRAGNVFFVDQNSVLRLDATTGVLTLVAGNGTPGFSGDNGPATSAQLNNPGGVAVGSSGSLYIADSGNARVRKVSGGVITTVAGSGTCCFSGDNIPATSASLFGPTGIAVDSNGDLYFLDGPGPGFAGYDRVRKVSGGVITTAAGGARLVWATMARPPAHSWTTLPAASP
jgi:streptogramin lyase